MDKSTNVNSSTDEHVVYASKPETNPSRAIDLFRGLNDTNILRLKNYLMYEYEPETDAEAIDMKNLQHLMKVADKHISKVCEEKLNECEFCDNIRVNPISGLKVLRKRKPATKTYNTSKKIEEIEFEMLTLENRLAELKDLLKEERVKVGYTEQDNGYLFTAKL